MRPITPKALRLSAVLPSKVTLQHNSRLGMRIFLGHMAWTKILLKL